MVQQAPKLETAQQPVPPTREQPYPSNFIAWYGVIILFGIYINSFLDRQILALLVPAIRADTGLSDTQLGFLGGPAFAISYVLAGLPIGWLADRMSRRLLIGGGQALWSAATFVFGLTRTFASMATARIWVGAGESTLGPAAYSLITDLFPPSRLAFALSVYGMGIYVGGGLASLVGGYALAAMGVTGAQSVSYALPIVGERQAWQVVFFLVALPTIPLSLLLLTLREPRRRGVQLERRADGTLRTKHVPFKEFLRYQRANWSTLLCHHVGFAFLSFSGYGAGFWNPTLFGRIYQWDMSYVGKSLGYLGIVGGPLGILFGGWLADRLLERGYSDAKVRVGLISSVLWFPCGILYPLMPTGTGAFLVLIPATFIGAMAWGVAPAGVQQLMPNQLRGQASAVYLFIINFIGLLLGPQIVPLISDFMFRDPMMLHYSLVATGVGAHLISTVLLFLCLRRYRTSLAFLDRWQQQQRGSAAVPSA